MKVKLQLPEAFSFSTTIPVRITDVNYGKHVGNDAVLSIIHEARMQFLKKYNYSELDFGGVSLIMRDAAIEFKAEMFYGDVLTAFVAIENIQKASFDLYYKIINQQDKTCVIAKTGMICFDYSIRKVVAIPEEVKTMFVKED